MSIRSLACLLVLSVCLVSAAEAQTAVGRQKVGEIEPFVISTAHPYAGGIDHEYVIHHPGATYVKAHFSRFDLADGDRLVVSNPEGTERYVFKGQGYKNKGADFWVTSILGDTAILRLESNNANGGYGFDVDYYAWGITDLFPYPDSPESVCGANDWMDVECYASSYPTEYDRAKRAVVVLYNGTENCTGVKVGCPNQIMSNEHCVTSQGEVDVTEVRFEYQRADCNAGSTTFSEAYLGDTFQQDNYTLDYSIFTVEGASDNYEHAEWDPRLPPVGERIYITGHPAGNPKKLSLEDDNSPTGLCQVDVSPQNGRGTDSDIGYLCDTTGGSSGSPVWSAESHKLIALHHFGGCYNGGVRIDLIHPEVEPILMSCCDNPPGVLTASATVNGDNRIDVDFNDADLDTVVEYSIQRSRTPGGPYDEIATVADSSPGTANGASYSYSDLTVSGGITYYYTVVAWDGATCRSEPAAEVSATATGACTLPPVFAGVGSALADTGSSICTIDVAWQPATAECGGPIVYDLYRSTVPGFTASGANLLASGLASTAFQDINQLVAGQTFFYMVRAIDMANGVEDDNNVQASAAGAGGCTTASSCPENPFVNVSPEGPMTVCQNGGPALSADLTGGTGPFHYQWLRDGSPVPGANGPTYTPNDMGTHVYNVRVRADACPDEVFDGIDTELTRVNTPFFGGIASAINPEDDTCTTNLDWTPATTVCNGPVDYVIYRDSTTPVARTPANVIAGGVTATSYVDLEGLANEQLYHYNVQARDASTGQMDGNAVEASVVTDGPFNGLQPAWLEDFENAATFSGWTVTTGPGTHTCGEFALGSSSGKRPTGGSGSYLIADNECSPVLPRTSTVAESPAMSMIIAGVQAVFLEADLWFDYSSVNGSEDASIDVWDGGQWVNVWADANTDFNGPISIDVSAHALGNSGFKVRFSYQNANADRHFAIDNVAFITDVMSVCSTEASGPMPIAAGSLAVGRAPGATDAIDLSWGTGCGSADYNLIYGDLANVASYQLAGAQCSLGTAGSHAWSGVPGGSLYFMVVGTDGAGTESSWGRDSGHGERNGGFGSNHCGVSTMDPTGICP